MEKEDLKYYNDFIDLKQNMTRRNYFSSNPNNYNLNNEEEED